MIKKILLVLAVLIVVFVIVVAMRPAEFHVTRSATINAPVATVFAQVNTLPLWYDWSPWAKLDPNATNHIYGSGIGAGAAMSWTGNNKVGEGKMTITESRANEFIKFDLEFIKPFKAHNTAEFIFKANGDQTDVTWNMLGKNNFMSKAFGLFMDCDKMLGSDFEKGLAQLKVVSEAMAKPTLPIEPVSTPPQP